MPSASWQTEHGIDKENHPNLMAVCSGLMGLSNQQKSKASNYG